MVYKLNLISTQQQQHKEIFYLSFLLQLTVVSVHQFHGVQSLGMGELQLPW